MINYKKYALYYLREILLIIILLIVQLSFLSTLNSHLQNIQPLLVFLIFFTVIVNYHKALFWALCGGVFMDLYSFHYFGFSSVNFIFTVMIINYLFNQFFTNRSYYTLT